MTSDKETDMLAKPPKSGGDISAWMAKWWQSGEIIPAKGFSTLTPLAHTPVVLRCRQPIDFILTKGDHRVFLCNPRVA
jgi:hypothetical protein